MNIKFRYFGDTSISKGTGKIVVAYDDFKRCGIAFCNPNDVYSKKTGRSIAAYRLLSNPIKVLKDDMSYGDWIDLFLDATHAPNWLYRDQTI